MSINAGQQLQTQYVGLLVRFLNFSRTKANKYNFYKDKCLL